MTEKFKAYAKSAEYIQKKIDGKTPLVGIVLGSGLGKLADRIKDSTIIPYKEIPGFPESTAIGHQGNLIFGEISGKYVIAMQGRFHFYEGYSMDQVTFPIRVMKLLGISYLFVSNAAGGLNLNYSIGDLVIIKDHINMLPNPLIGPNMEEFGPRFPDMTRPYDPKLRKLAKEIASEMDITLQEGVYVGCTGPCYETPAEYKFFRSIGSDVVGMSTVPEIIVARHCDIPCFGMSVVTDLAHDDMPEDYQTDGKEIVKAADHAASKMTALFEKMIEKL